MSVQAVSTEQRMEFLRVVGFDLSPDPANIPELKASGWTNEMLAETYGVSIRTIQRYHKDKHRCPGYPLDSCLTDVRGGGLCSYCRKTKAGV